MGSSSNVPKSSANHHPLTYSVSMASMPTNSVNRSSNGEHRRLNRSASEPVAQLQPQQQRPTTINNASRYKTELCRPFEENGLCKYGDKCQFAHGLAELRNLVRHPKYKTELCRTFHSSGFCPYGPRCHFIHNDNNRNPINNLNQSGNINIPSAVESHDDNARMITGVDITLKNFSRPGSRGDLSPNTSSISGSPTSCSSFLIETDNLINRFSPTPQTAPPFITKNSFFGQDFVPFPSIMPLQQQSQQQQSPLSPIITQRLVANNWQSNNLPSIDNLNAAMGELNVCPKINSSTLNMSISLNDNISKLRLPIFSQLAFPQRHYIGSQ